jgi:hypothetical protein
VATIFHGGGKQWYEFGSDQSSNPEGRPFIFSSERQADLIIKDLDKTMVVCLGQKWVNRRSIFIEAIS